MNPQTLVVKNRDGSDLTPEQVAEREAAAEKRKAEEQAWREKQEYQRVHAVELSIAELRKEAAEKTAEADNLERMLKEFPDLLRNVNRWRKVRYYSPSVNPRVDQYDQTFNCSCCNDSPLEIWPYIETENGRVYSNPPRFIVGEKHWIHGSEPSDGWEDEMRGAGIPEVVVESIRYYFNVCREERIQIASE
jgi:hypothetical protein